MTLKGGQNFLDKLSRVVQAEEMAAAKLWESSSQCKHVQRILSGKHWEMGKRIQMQANPWHHPGSDVDFETLQGMCKMKMAFLDTIY